MNNSHSVKGWDSQARLLCPASGAALKEILVLPPKIVAETMPTRIS